MTAKREEMDGAAWFDAFGFARFELDAANTKFQTSRGLLDDALDRYIADRDAYRAAVARFEHLESFERDNERGVMVRRST